MRGIKMENIKHKLYAKLDGTNIIEIKTEEFIKDPENWSEIGEQESRHYHGSIINDQGVPLYKIENGEKVARVQSDINDETTAVIEQQEEDRKDITKAGTFLKALALVVADLNNKTEQEIIDLVKAKIS